MREVLNEIHKSNLTKIEGEDIKMSSIGKILKPLSYKKPNIKKVLGI
jgi:predicted HAD superfamily Cof-like phosphohydrolase